MKKALAITLCMIVLIGIIPISASAATGTEGIWTYNSNESVSCILSCSQTSGVVSIPAVLGGLPVVGIGDGSGTNIFGGLNTTVTSVLIPEGITYISDSAFMNCQGLTSIVLPDSLENLGQNVFFGCSALASANVPRLITNINSGLFWDCSSLSSLVVEGTASIQWGAFQGTAALGSITFLEGAPIIQSGTFSGNPGIVLNYIEGKPGWPESGNTYLSNGVSYATSMTPTMQSILVNGGSSDIPLVVNATPVVFKAVVPLTLPVHVSAEGVVTVATNAVIKNESSYGQVQVKSAYVSGTNGWELVDCGDDFGIKSVNSKVFGFGVKSGMARLDVDLATGNTNYPVNEFTVIQVGASRVFNYVLKVAPQSAGLSEESIASVVIVIGWAT